MCSFSMAMFTEVIRNATTGQSWFLQSYHQMQDLMVKRTSYIPSLGYHWEGIPVLLDDCLARFEKALALNEGQNVLYILSSATLTLVG